MKEKQIAVVMGGPSAEREVSLRTGDAVLAALEGKGYQVVGIDLIPDQFAEQLRQSGAEVVFNAVHGLYGEDGCLQGMLDMLEIPYTGSGVLASAAAMDKVVSKRLFAAAGIPTPRALFFRQKEADEKIQAQLLKEFSLPIVLKAACQGSSIGTAIVKTAEELPQALKEVFRYGQEIVAEEFISGPEITVAVIGTGTWEALPVVQIAPHSGCYDYTSKYTTGKTDYLVPAPLPEEIGTKLQELAIQAVAIFGCKGVARVDMMLDQEFCPYVLEINTIPGMTATSLVPKAAAAVGISFPDLCERLLLQAVQ